MMDTCEAARTVGFLVNPIAGMGGAVGLKGTDGPEILREAVERGAVPGAAARARRALEAFLSHGQAQGLRFLTAGGGMGQDVLEGMNGPWEVEVVYPGHAETDASDTRAAVSAMKAAGARLVLFCGGDGTARDVFQAARQLPVLGIPAGVKMHSAVFSTTPETCGELLADIVTHPFRLEDAEVMDIDEEAYRDQRLNVKLYGYARIPANQGITQAGKSVFGGDSTVVAKEEIADWVVENMKSGVLYLLGAGTTVMPIKASLGMKGTLLGVDAFMDGKQVGTDLNEKGIRKLLDRCESARVIVTPIGAQGFIFGRGNQQFSPQVLTRVGKDGITVVATPLKLASTPVLRVDTGAPGLDRELKGYLRVLVGYMDERMVKVE